MASALAPAPTGLDLRLARVRAGPTQIEVARVLGVSRQRMGQIEGMLRPPSSCVTRYLRALDVAAHARDQRR